MLLTTPLRILLLGNPQELPKNVPVNFQRDNTTEEIEVSVRFTPVFQDEFKNSIGVTAETTTADNLHSYGSRLAHNRSARTFQE